ncbi:serine/threonine-protein kinase Nek5 [Acrasis kona]|uniref:non-specific serine/threonine protein kinase n=1 Tax=Acrasis kona TaxID=1008807 RepID=A0AAW2YY48_9EUKA
MKECINVKSIKHVNVITILDYFTIQNSASATFCLVTPHYQGGDMEALLQKARAERTYIPANVVLLITYQLASGLKAIHDNGIIHRDIKPKNIFLTPQGQSLVIGDFGLARNQSSITSRGSVAGEEDYMSFEMKSQKPYSSLTDMWSFGCVLYDTPALKQCKTYLKDMKSHGSECSTCRSKKHRFKSKINTVTVQMARKSINEDADFRHTLR